MTIASHRKAKGMTQADLADLIGVHLVTVGKWECGLTEPRGATLYALAKVFKCKRDEIVMVPRKVN